jgi:phenylpropionate dioxygenase-like ring-hydroxylating dioxygenase large terminal subunit
LVAQEEEVHGKKRAYEKLKEEEKEIQADIKKTELEIQRLEEDLRIGEELEEEVNDQK